MKNLIYITILFSLILLFAAPITYANHEAGHKQKAVEIIDDIIEDIKNPTTNTTSLTEGLARDGVFGCTGGEYGSVGAQGPSGSYVPVFDNAVFDQQRLLTYKECILDGVVVSKREELISFMIQSVVEWVNEGFDGNPAYPANVELYMLEDIMDPNTESFLNSQIIDAVPELFRRELSESLTRNYASQTRTPEDALSCVLTNEQLKNLSKGNFYASGGLKSFYKFVTDPACNPLFSYNTAKYMLKNSNSSSVEVEKTKLGWGSGFRTTERDEVVDLGGGRFANVKRTVTPGFLIAETLKQTIGTGLRQTENATEIDQIISALMSNIGTEMLTDIEGLSGLSKAFGGQPSNIDRLVSNSSKRTRGSMFSVATKLVDNTLRVEKEYTTERRNSIIKLKQYARQIETWENTCWMEVVNSAKEKLAERLEAQACLRNGSTSTPCGITANVTVSIATDEIAIRVPSEGNISVSGLATRGESTIAVTIVSGDITVGPIEPTVATDGKWASDPIDLSTIPNGTSTVSVIETLPNGTGTLAPITAEVLKITTLAGVELIPPVALPTITVTATISGASESVTISVNSTRSRAIITQNINPILDVFLDNIFRSSKALEVLAQIRSALAATTSASGQRFILDKLDKLVAARVLHTEAQLREARNQSSAVKEAMNQLLAETKTNWEKGWCKPANWEQNVQ